MINSVICVLIAIYCIPLSEQSPRVSTNNAAYYTAGVVEFRAAQFEHASWLPRGQLNDNLEGYTEIIKSDEAKRTDIIVFPEMTLNTNEEATFLPDPDRVFSAPCDQVTNENGEKYHDFLIHLSCLARNVSKYIVINLCEKAYCERRSDDPRPCASTGVNIFNTNAVFDRNGTVISRYRKVHLWGEPRNTTFRPSFGYFDTDFGVRFGHFICFDLLFYMPAQEMVERMGIRDFIFPTMWYSQLPFLTAVQIQSAWSYANNVNLLAAGASFPAKGTTGTGIYAGHRGALIAVMTQKYGLRKMFVAQLPKHSSQNHHAIKRHALDNTKLKMQDYQSNDDLFLKRDYLEDYQTLPISLCDGGSIQRTLCQRNETLNTKFCCDFDLEWSEKRSSLNTVLSNDNSTKKYFYRLGVFNGLRKEQAPESNYLRNCALIACIGPKISDCAKTFNDETSTRVVFRRLSIEATFPQASQFLLMPNSLKEDLLPLNVSHFQWQEYPVGGSRRVRYALTQSVGNLLTFSIYGNYFDSTVNDEHETCNNTSESSRDICNSGSRNFVAASKMFVPLLILLCSVVIIF